MTSLVAARVRVPCSTSNFGSGYDTIGLALNRYLDAAFVPDESGDLSVERSGTLSRMAADEPDLVAGAFVRRFGRGTEMPSGVIRLSSEVPVGRGLGASAAARVAGFALADAALRHPGDADAIFAAAVRGEGHPDNVAPCLFGGLRAVASTPGGPVIMELGLSEDVGFAYAAPAARVSTDEARSVLPKQVPHHAAAASLGRVVALTRGLAQADPELIRIGVTDELHVPHRLPLIPRVTAAIAAGLEAGAWAVTISGAGSGLIGLCPTDDSEAVAAAMHQVFDAGSGDPECVGFAVRPDFDGLRLT